MIRFAFLLLVTVLYTTTAQTETVFGQNPKEVKLKIEGANVTLSNIRFLSGTPAGQLPQDPKPLDSSKMLPINTWLWLHFDYETDFTPTEEPTGMKSIILGLDFGGKFFAYAPVALDKKSGDAYLGFSNSVGYGGPTGRFDGEIDFTLALYGTRNNTHQIPAIKSSEKFKVKAKIDGIAQISETQFDALKDMYRRVLALEKKVAELESRIPSSK